MAQKNAYTVAGMIEARRLGEQTTGIPTISDQATADAIDRMYEAEFSSRLEAAVREAKAEALEKAERALNKECLKFQPSWGSNAEDVARLDGVGKVMSWMKARAAKYRETLPRTINLKDTYKGLSDGAVIEVDRKLYSHRIGFGDFISTFDSDIIVGRKSDMEVKLVSHNLD